MLQTYSMSAFVRSESAGSVKSVCTEPKPTLNINLFKYKRLNQSYSFVFLILKHIKASLHLLNRVRLRDMNLVRMFLTLIDKHGCLSGIRSHQFIWQKLYFNAFGGLYNHTSEVPREEFT